jgi:hypothetical protein
MWQIKHSRNRIRSLVTLILLLPAAAPAGELDVDVIIRRSVEANQADWKAAPEYSYYEREREENGDTKTYAVLMILASPYWRQVLVNGKPLPFKEEKKEQQKLEEAIARRWGESAHDRQERIAQYEKDRKRDQLLMEQLTNAFDFKLLGQQKKGPCDTYVLEAMPRPGYQPLNTETEVLTGMQGKLWIDKKSFQWVRVEAQVVRPVTIEGFLARVEPGTRFELEKMPVEDRVWLPKRFSMQARARILFLFTYGTQEEETYFNYRKVRPLQTGAALEEQVAAAKHFLTTDLP